MTFTNQMNLLDDVTITIQPNLERVKRFTKFQLGPHSFFFIEL